MLDQFEDEDTVFAPARRTMAITPDNVNSLPVVMKAVYVGTGGTIVLRAIDDEEDVTIKNVASGDTLSIRAKAVKATGTTATDIVGLY